MRVPVRASALLATCLALGCGRSSLATFSPPSDDPASAQATTTSATGSGSAGGSPCPDPDPADIVSLEGIRTATLFGTALHVQGIIDGQDNYAVIDLSSTPALLVGLRPDLLGGARWIHETGPYYARLSTTSLDVLDASDPEAALLVSSTPLAEAPAGAFSGALASDGAGLYLGLWSEAEQGHYLSRLDLSDPAKPGLPIRIADFPLETWGDRAEAQGSLWLTWGPSTVALFDLTAASSINSHSFVTNGTHNYGELTRLKTDGVNAATTLENKAYAFLYYGDSLNFVVYSSFGGGEKSLLDVAQGAALLAVPRGDGGAAVVGFEIGAPPASEQPAKPTGMDVTLEESAGPLDDYRALTSDQGHLIVSDGSRLFDVPIGATTTVSPLVVVRAAETTCP